MPRPCSYAGRRWTPPDPLPIQPGSARDRATSSIHPTHDHDHGLFRGDRLNLGRAGARRPGGTVASLPGMSTATMTTSEGPITIELFDEDAPETVANFKKLAGDGFYDGLIFHRVIRDFMIQGGCPQGTGTGGPGYTFKDEFNQHKIVRGALAMANAGPNTNGSQFFLVTTGEAPWLDGKHTVFGQVTEGMDVVDKIEGKPTDARDKPTDDIRIETLAITA
jgi:peptidyl-prolyl cis-trans isomerase B (cyclophilin B)